MSPIELLEDVKSRFTPLLHREAEKLESLLRQALRAYQDRAGYIQKIRVTDNATSIPKPTDFLALIGASDKQGDMVYSDDFGTDITLEYSWNTKSPVTVSYIANLADLDLKTGIVPPEIVGVVSNYLEALIAIPNYDRIRRVSIAGKVDASTIPDENTLNQRKLDLELDMSSRRAILPGFTIYGAGGN